MGGVVLAWRCFDGHTLGGVVFGERRAGLGGRFGLVGGVGAALRRVAGERAGVEGDPAGLGVFSTGQDFNATWDRGVGVAKATSRRAERSAVACCPSPSPSAIAHCPLPPLRSCLFQNRRRAALLVKRPPACGGDWLARWFRRLVARAGLRRRGRRVGGGRTRGRGDARPRAPRRDRSTRRRYRQVIAGR